MIGWTQGGRAVMLWPGQTPEAPLLWLNAGTARQGEEVQAALQALCPGGDWALAAVSGLDWDRDLVPWDAPPPAPGAAPLTGGADAYLAELTGQLLPAAEARLGGVPRWRGLAGYSLGGLFALWAVCQSEAFSQCACLSGSLWYPGWADFLKEHAPKPPQPPVCQL